MNKSPFLIYQNFISPLMCEQIVDAAELYSPDTTSTGLPIVTGRRVGAAEQVLFDRIQNIVPEVERHYGISYKGTEPMYVSWYPENSEGQPTCESSSRLRGKWVRTKERDISGVLFLSDYQDNVPFDSEFEVFGGKLEFPQWGFGFNPQRGTLILYPSGPHFVNSTTKILVGDLYQIKLHVAAQVPLLFNAKDYPGDYKTWFREVN